MIKRYRSKHVTNYVDAFKYEGDFINSDGTPIVPDWAIEALESGRFFFKDQGDLYTRTPKNGEHPDGYALIPVGDYIIKCTNGTFLGMTPDIFENFFEVCGPGKDDQIKAERDWLAQWIAENLSNAPCEMFLDCEYFDDDLNDPWAKCPTKGWADISCWIRQAQIALRKGESK